MLSSAAFSGSLAKPFNINSTKANFGTDTGCSVLVKYLQKSGGFNELATSGLTGPNC